MPNIQDDIIKELGIDQLPPEKQEEILTAMTEVILKRITLRVLENFSEAQKDEFDKICAAGDQEKVSQYLAANVVDYENIIKNEISQFKNEMHETVNTLLA
jgi:hypothetical protein